MTKKDAAARNSTATTASTDSWKSTDTVKAASLFRGQPNISPMQVKTDAKQPHFEKDFQISPGADDSSHATSSLSSSPSVSPRDHKMNDFVNYRRELSVLDIGGGRVPQIQHNPPTASTSHGNQLAPWLNSSSNGPPVLPNQNFSGSFFDDTDQLSPSYRPNSGRNGQVSDSADGGYFNDERRPSIASITTASSSGSRGSASRAAIHKKLQGFFGEDYNGRDGSDSSLPSHGTGKEHRSHSYSRHRERNLSNATETAGRDASGASPGSSRPRTPVPSSDVVPFLYQDSQDISRYGEAPVREKLSGLDKDRYMNDDASHNQPKTTASNRSGHSSKIHLPGYHRHNRSIEDTRVLRPSVSRESTAPVKSRARERTVPNAMSSVTSINNPRAISPTPSGISGVSTWSQTSTINMNNGSTPPSHSKKHGFFHRLRRPKDKDDYGNSSLKNLTGSSRSLQKADLSMTEMAPESRLVSRQSSVTDFNEKAEQSSSRPLNAPRAGTFNKLRLGKGKGARHDENDVNGNERNNYFGSGAVFDLDTNLSDMEGILARPPPLTPLDSGIFTGNVEKDPKQDIEGYKNLGWNAPDSWAVKKIQDENMSRLPEIDESGIPPREDKQHPFCIRIFRVDGTFNTLPMNLNSTVTDVINQLGKKAFLTDGLDNFQIVMKKHDLQRVLDPGERPVVIQKRLLEQAGYEEKDKLEDVGREDNSYLCRFSFVPITETGYTSGYADLGFRGPQKYSHVDLTGRNLVTIPISLYSKAAEIISINLSRNLSIDLPKDFIQSCLNLRDIKYTNNEARKLPLSLRCASRLTMLDVSNNWLEQLEHADLDQLVGLVSLKLANNRLTHLPPYFNRFRTMRTLNVSSNFLEKFPDFLCDLEGLQDLDLSFNAIARLPDEIGKLKSLERLVITNNRLSGQLPDTFGQLTALREVDVRYNALSSIDVIANLPRVEQLSADHNSISSFEGTFSRIRVLRLNSNPVTRFEILNAVPTLTTLILSNAKLAHIPDAAFDKMSNLVKLSLDKNHFVSLPQHIGKLRKLEYFSIARNALNSLPPEIGCLTELRHLDVRENNLKKLPMELWWANRLETLNVSSNVLDNFPKPASRPPQVPGDVAPSSNNSTPMQTPGLSHSSSFEELGPLEAFNHRRPSQASSGLLSVGSSPVPGAPDRKSSVVSLYGRGGRKTSVVSRSASSEIDVMTPASSVRKESSGSSKLSNTFAASLRNLYLADNQLDDDCFDELILLSELKILNLSYNDLNDIPQRSLKSWPQLTELYLSGNELASLPSDDFEEFSLLQVLHINGNKFQTLPAELGKAHKLAVLDVGNNLLKYNVSNWPYDWNWNWNPVLRYLNLSGNKRLEIKPNLPYGSGSNIRDGKDLTDFSSLPHLRILGLMDVTLTMPMVPDETEDRRVRTSGSLDGYMAYGMADTLGRNEHLSTIDLVVPRFNGSESETLLGMFDGQALSTGGSKIAKYLHENFGQIFNHELRRLNTSQKESPIDALRRAFLSLNKDLATAATHITEDRPLHAHRGSTASAVLNSTDLQSGGVATVMYLHQSELYVANVGDAQALLIHSEGGHRILTRKHDPAEPNERQRIRDAGGWVSRQGKLNDILEVSRAFGYVQIMPAVQASPHVSHVTLKETDEMILIASRELWEYLTPEVVVDVARAERGDLMRAAQRLRDLAMAFGSSGKIMVMMIGVSELKKRERNRLNRGPTSISMNPSGIPDESYLPAKRGKFKKGEDVEDSMLRRLKAEVQAPVGDLSIVFTDIKSSTLMWETFPNAMRSAIKLHNEVMRRQLRIIGGYEVKTEGDSFMVSFPTATSALLWCFSVQSQLLEVQWPSEVTNSVLGQEIFDNDQTLIFRGLSVRMGIHWGNPVCEKDPVTRRMDYFGPIVNRAARIMAVADGGQITVSADFISEIQRCLETFSETDRSSSTGSEDAFESDVLGQSIRRELRSLSSQGFEVKDIGERKLKGLENPEYIYLMYPHALSGRIQYQQRLADGSPVDKHLADSGGDQHSSEGQQKNGTNGELTDPAMLSRHSQLSIDTDAVWDLWSVSLRLEMLCSALEDPNGSGLQPPETAMLERMKNRGGEVTDRFLVNFVTHQVSRIETCIATLQTRFLARGIDNISDFSQLAAPMADVFKDLEAQLAELHRYRSIYGELPDTEAQQIEELE